MYFFIDVRLIYLFVFTSGVMQSDSIVFFQNILLQVYVFFRLYSIRSYYKILSTVPSASSKSLLLLYFMYIVSQSHIPHLSLLSSLSSLATTGLLSVSVCVCVCVYIYIYISFILFLRIHIVSAIIQYVFL